MDKKKLWYRSRGIEQMEQRFGKFPITKFLKHRIKEQDTVRVLEIGFGEGKCLIDLREQFRDIELYGINNIRQGNMHKRKDFLTNAKKFGVNISPKNLPKPLFYDAGEGLKFEYNYFDIIISQVAFPYVEDKSKLVEEMWRVLKPGGKTFIHIDSFDTDYHDIMSINKETPRWIVYKDDKIVKISSCMNEQRKKGFDIKVRPYPKSRSGGRGSILLMTKNARKKLNLGMKLEQEKTIDFTRLRSLPDVVAMNVAWWGKRSVYKKA